MSHVYRVVFLLLVVATGTTCAQFLYSDFGNVSTLTMNGSAAQAGGNKLRLTQPSGGQAGSAYHQTAQDVAGAFTTEFSFQVLSGGGPADGLTFVIHDDPNGLGAIGNSGQELGYAQGMSNALVIELDYYGNGWSGVGDLGSNEISVHAGFGAMDDGDEVFSIGSVMATNYADGLPHTLTIDYIPGLLNITLDNAMTPTLSVPWGFVTGGTWTAGGSVPGMTLMNGTDAFVGFTAATGGQWAAHEILSWSWNPNQIFEYVVTPDGSGGATLAVNAIPSGTFEGWTLISMYTPFPVDQGPMFGLTPDNFTWTIPVLAPFPTIGNPLHWLFGTPGVFPDVPFVIPPGVMTPFAGQTWDFTAIAMDAAGLYIDHADVARVTW